MFKRRRNSKKTEENINDVQNKTDDDTCNSLSRSCDSFSTNNFMLSPAFSHSSNLSSTSTRNSSTILNMFTKTISQVRNVFSSNSSLDHGRGTTADILESRERQKKQMEALNDLLANFIEKVRFLEAQNRVLSVDIEHYRSCRGDEMLSIYETELFQARKVMDEASKTKTDLENEFARLRDDLAYQRNKYEEIKNKHDIDRDIIENLITKLSDIESDIIMFRRKNEVYENELNRLKNENASIQKQLQTVRNDTNRETMSVIEQKNQVTITNEEIDFLIKCNDKETEQLRSMIFVNMPEINGEYFKNELAMAIREIRTENEAAFAQTKTDFESQYQLKVKEIEYASSLQINGNKQNSEESKILRVKLNDFRGKMLDVEMKNILLEKQIQDLTYRMEDDQKQFESTMNDRNCEIRKMNDEIKFLLNEMNKLFDKKQSLDAEIAVYRKILEDEFIRGKVQ